MMANDSFEARVLELVMCDVRSLIDLLRLFSFAKRNVAKHLRREATHRC